MVLIFLSFFIKFLDLKELNELNMLGCSRFQLIDNCIIYQLHNKKMLEILSEPSFLSLKLRIQDGF